MSRKRAARERKPARQSVVPALESQPRHRTDRQAGAIAAALRGISSPLVPCRIVFPGASTQPVVSAVVETYDHRVAVGTCNLDGLAQLAPGSERFDHSVRVMLSRDFPPYGIED